MNAHPPATPTAAALDDNGRVAGDAACVQCGYNLRTLLFDAACPECGQSVAYSIRGFFLSYAEPRWVKGLARGVLLVLIAVGGMVLGALVLWLVTVLPVILEAARNPRTPPTIPIQHTAAGQAIIFMALTGLAIAGLLDLTRRDPALADGAEGFTARRVIRFSCILLPVPIVLNLVVVLCMPALPVVAPGGPPPTPATIFGPGFATFITLGFVSGIVGAVAYAVTPIALFRHLMGLVRRVPRPGLVRFARIEFWGLLVSATMLVAGYAFMAVTMLPALGPLMAAATTMPATAPAGAPTTIPATGPGPSVTVYEWKSSPAPASAPSGPAALYALGYLTPTTGPATSSAPATMPATPPFPRLGGGFFFNTLLGGCAGGLGGCGTFGFGIAGVVLLIMARTALFKAAREAEQNALGV